MEKPFGDRRAHTPWEVFIWAAAILSALIGGVWWRVEAVSSKVEDAQLDIAVVKNDTAWIKQRLEVRDETITKR